MGNRKLTYSNFVADHSKKRHSIFSSFRVAMVMMNLQVQSFIDLFHNLSDSFAKILHGLLIKSLRYCF